MSAHNQSISSTRGSALLHAYLDKVHSYHSTPSSYPPLTSALTSACSYRIASAPKPLSRPSSRPPSAWPTPPMSPTQSSSSHDNLLPLPSHSIRMVEKQLPEGKDLKTQDVFEKVVRTRKGKEKAVGEVWLDGQTPTRPTTTSLTAPPFLFTYALSSRTISLHTPSAVHKLPLEEGESFWDWFSQAQTDLSTASNPGNRGKGWRGGWAGWFGYEMKEESLQGYKRSADAANKSEEVDACWAWSNWILERQSTGEWSLRGLIEDRLVNSVENHGQRPGSLVEWLDILGIAPGLTSAEFDDLAENVEKSLREGALENGAQPADGFPKFTPVSNGEDYQARIDLSRESIRQGDSYELTLTTSFRSQLEADSDPYALYLRLRTFNPAYYSTFMSFPSLATPRGNGIHVLSSSPERFLKIEREKAGRVVEMMPIKGTRARPKVGQCVCEEGRGCGGKDKGSKACQEERERVDEEIGMELQGDVKERAENLMVRSIRRKPQVTC